jgi:hypothetical protein
MSQPDGITVDADMPTISQRIWELARRIVVPLRGRNEDGPRRFPHEEITWECSRRVVWIASHSTEFLGMVEEHNGLFVANDTSRGTYNTFRTLSDAMRAFETPVETAFAA